MTQAQNGLASSADLKARVVDFMDRTGELLTHELADYRAPFGLTVTTNSNTGDVVGYDLDHRLLAKEMLVYFATIERPILWTETEPIYITQLAAAIGKEHPALRPACRRINEVFKQWKDHLFVGTKTGTSVHHGEQPPPAAEGDWKNANVWTAPVGTPLPQDDLSDEPMIEA